METKTTPTRKYRYLIVLQGLYLQNANPLSPANWDDIHEWPNKPEHYKEARQDIKDYRKNAPEYMYRIIRRREKTAE